MCVAVTLVAVELLEDIAESACCTDDFALVPPRGTPS